MNVAMVVGGVAVAVALILGFVIVSFVVNALPDTIDSDTETEINNTRDLIYTSFGIGGLGVLVIFAFGIISILRG